MEYARRSPNSAVEEPQIALLEAIFGEVNALRHSLLLPFKRTDDPDSLRPQIRSARARVDEQIKAIRNSLEESTKLKLGRPLPDVDRRRVFVVHGRNMPARDAIFNFLSRINLSPIEWEEAIDMTGSTAPSNLTTIEHAFSNARAAVIILSGDDIARLGRRYLSETDGPYERLPTGQARPNVIFEAGMSFGYYPARTLFVSFGKTRPISDIDGINILYLSDDAKSRKKIAGRLTNAGCAVDVENKTDWLTAGDFKAAFHDPDQMEGEEHAGVKITQRLYSSEEKATIKPKVWIDLRNDSGSYLVVRHLGWTQSPMGIQIKRFYPSMQLKIAQYWCPEPVGVETLHVPPTESIRVWVQPADQHDENDLRQRCLQEGRIAILDLRVNDKEVKIPI